MAAMAVRLPLLARRLHKWLALLVGVQIAIWTLSGLYMTAVHIEIIHGDRFIREDAAAPLSAVGLADPLAAAAQVPGAEGVKLARLLGRPVYVVSSDAGAALLDARTGERLPRPTEQQVRQVAEQRFAGSEPLEKLELIETLPFEVRGRKPPLWRAEFGGWNKPTLYISPETAELVTRRHELWRVFDFVWMLHIMDYEEREDVNTWLLQAASVSAGVMLLAGAWLLFYTLPLRRRKPRT
jgi:hypothetical protein